MRKFAICVIVLLLGFTKNSFAQEAGTITAGFESPISLYGNNGLRTVEWAVYAGYNVTDWLAISVKTELSAGMFRINNVRTYNFTETLGGGLLFNVLKMRDAGVLSVRIFSGSTVGRDDWKYTYYSGGVYFNAGKNRIEPFIGIGLKYYDTNKNVGRDNYLRYYFSFGFRFN